MLSPIILFVFASVVLILLLLLLLFAFFTIRRLRQYSRRLPSQPPPPKANGELALAVVDAVFPVVIYDKTGKGKAAPEYCTVCMSEFAAGDGVRVLTGCRHAFHSGCIDRWLAEHATCPVCRSNLTVVPDEVLVLATGDDLINANEDGGRNRPEGKRLSTVDSLCKWIEVGRLEKKNGLTCITEGDGNEHP